MRMSLMYGKEAETKNNRQTASTTLFRTEEQKTKNVGKSIPLDFPKVLITTKTYSYKLFQNSFYACNTVGTKV